TNITRTIHKDNVIRFEGNRYSVPLGTFQSGAKNIAYVSVTGRSLNIFLHLNDSPIAVHKLSEEKGKVVTDPKHRQRPQTRRDQLKEAVMDRLADQEDSIWLIKKLHQ